MLIYSQFISLLIQLSLQHWKLHVSKDKHASAEIHDIQYLLVLYEERTNTMQYSHCLDTCIRCSNCHVNHHLHPILGPLQLCRSSLYQAPQTNLTRPF